MDLLSLSTFPSALLVWQLTPSRWVITVVCKATYALTPGVVAIAQDQEPIQEVDAHWDDDPKRSLFAPADLVPFKQRADVMLVGSAYARNGQPARSITVRLNVGKIDKSIEVLCPRVRTRDGELREGKRWTKMPLLYERAAGGQGTDNPVGISFEGARDPYGQLALPNLQAPGLNLPVDKLPPPIGFGPIAAEWPARAGRLPKGHEERDYARAPFGEAFDPLYFQAAPADQQLDSLKPTERIALDNLLAKHPVFVTSLPGDKIRARVETSGVAPREVSLVADSLWIDTDRAICTLTYRGKIDVEHPEQEGRILVAATRTDQPIPWARLAPAPPPPSSQSSQSSPPPPGITASKSGAPPPGPSAVSAPVVSASVASPAGSPRAPVPGTVVSPVAAQKAPPPPGRVSTPPAPVVPSPPPAATPRAATRPPIPALPVEDEPPDSREEPRTVDIEIDMIEAVEVTMTEPPARMLTQTAALRPITAPGTGLVPEVPALPFQPAPPGWTPPAAVPSRPGLLPLPGVPTDLTTTPAFGAPMAPAASGLHPPAGAVVSGLHPPAGVAGSGLPPSAAVAASGLRLADARGVGALSPSGGHERATLPDWGDSSPDFPPVAPPPLITSPAWNTLSPSKAVPLAGAPPLEGPLGALEASNAAAAGFVDPSRGAHKDRPSDAGRQEIDAAPTPQPSGPAAVVELLWFDPAAPQRHARHPLLSVFKRSPARPAKPADPEPARGSKPDTVAPPAVEPSEEPASPDDLARAWVYETVTRSAPTPLPALESVLESAEDEAPPAPALAVVTGTLELCLDEIEMLRAIAAAASPLAASDKKLKEVLDVAAEMQKTPMQGMPDFAEGLSSRIRDAWTRANKGFPADHLTSSAERLLLEQRAYQRRELLDDAWIRALLTGEGPSVPVYLPAKIAKRLPLFRRFSARLLVEVLWQQDQYETHPVALRTLALGRLSGRQRKKRAGEGGRSR